MKSRVEVRAVKTEVVDVEVDTIDAWGTLERLVLEQHGVAEWEYIDGSGRLCRDEDCGHGSPLIERGPAATDEQRRVFEACRLVRSSLYEARRS